MNQEKEVFRYVKRKFLYRSDAGHKEELCVGQQIHECLRMKPLIGGNEKATSNQLLTTSWEINELKTMM